MTTASTTGPPCLQPISGGEAVIPACDGRQTITDNGEDIFTGWIDSNFKGWDANERGEATPATTVQVYELQRDATSATMFGSLSDDNEKLCFTQHQILDFVRSQPDLRRTGDFATFFAFKSKGKLFVADVRRCGGGTLRVRVSRFEDDDVWHARNRHRVVVPRLAA